MESIGASEPMDVQANLQTFDELDFEVFSNQRWDEFSRSHSDDIVVYWPDGRETRGLERHLDDLRALFAYAPDMRIRQHPIRFGSGEWTCATSLLLGTFTQPMKTPDGKTIPPTGKSFSVPMCTVGRWRDGVMVEEHLFFDSLTFMKQMGVA
jgi:hypothetical protein